MKAIINAIKIIIIFVILFGVGTAIVDYNLMKKGEVPIFNQSEYNSRQKIQSYKGLFYKAQRKIKTSTREPLPESSDIKFQVLTLNYNIPNTWKEKNTGYTLEVEPITNCAGPALLYYADTNNKIYTYCLEDIQIVEKGKKQSLSDRLSKDNKLFQETFKRLGYMGLSNDNTTQIFNNRDDGFVSSDIVIYQCDSDTVKDTYIAPIGTPFQLDFCTFKDDDFKFIFEILDESEKVTDTSNMTPEVIYEDENYRYEFPYPKSQSVFVTTPAIRGKPETKTPLIQVLNSGLVTIDDLINKGLEVNKINKTTETP